MKYKKCSKCKKSKSVDDFHEDRTTKVGYKSQCKQCQNDYGFAKRQKILKERFDSGEESIKQCECGNYFNSIPKGSIQRDVLSRCQECARAIPLVKAYSPEFKRTIWVRLPLRHKE